MFRSVAPSPADPVYLLSQQVREDTAPEKVDLGFGVYRNERGLYHELRALGAVCTPVKIGNSSLITKGTGKAYPRTARRESRLRSDNRQHGVPD